MVWLFPLLLVLSLSIALWVLVRGQGATAAGHVAVAQSIGLPLISPRPQAHLVCLTDEGPWLLNIRTRASYHLDNGQVLLVLPPEDACA